MGALAVCALAAAAVAVAAEGRLDRLSYRGTPVWPERFPTLVFAPQPLDSLLGAPVDHDGVRVVDYPAPLGRQYSPTAVAQHALSLSLHAGDPRARAAFLAQVDWLRRTAHRSPTRGTRWYFAFDWPINRQRAPWASAQTQGAVSAALARAWRLTGDTAYRALALDALQPMIIGADSGGVATRIGAYLVFDEYPGSDYIVLDGWLAALAGACETAALTGDAAASRIRDRGLDALTALIDEFDGPLGAYYSSRRDLPSPAYHTLNTNLLAYLAACRPSAVLTRKRDAWRAAGSRNGRGALLARFAYQSLNYRVILPIRGPALPCSVTRDTFAHRPAARHGPSASPADRARRDCVRLAGRLPRPALTSAGIAARP